MQKKTQIKIFYLALLPHHLISSKILRIEEKNLRDCVKFMPKSTFSFLFINYWRKIDKKILLSFFLLFFLGLFFSYSSTSSLAGERLNKVYYFFIKHLIYTLAIIIMLIISFLKTDLLVKLVIPYL